MTYDLKITGGTIVDGTGGEPFEGEVGITAGRIVAVGEAPDDARETLDAAGCIVTPGFLDVHTHYDGQASWDDALQPSIRHGVTTAVMGNCGVGFAPVRRTDHDRLVRLMEGVEDIPGTALSEGLSWEWESFPDYMDALEKTPRTMDIAAMVTHDPIRVFVMDERANAEDQATDAEIARMRDLVREGLEAGAIGFSTGRSDLHRTADGEWTPASEATAKELAGIASAFEGLDHGVIQAVSDFDLERDQDRFPEEWAVIESYVKAAGGRPFSISLMQRDFAPDQWKKILAGLEQLDAEGYTVRAQVAPRAIGVFLGLQCTFHPFMGYPAYKEIAHLPLDERVARMKDPGFKAKLLAQKSDKVSTPENSVPPIADLMIETMEFVAEKLFTLSDDPDYEQPPEQSIAAKARDRGVSVWEQLYDTAIARDGRELIYLPIYNYTELSYDNVLAMMKHPLSIMGLSDGGAHVGTVCDASFPTYLIAYWTRDRTRGERIALPTAIKKLTADLADYLGLSDRGRIKPGLKADLNVIDYDNLRLEAPHMVRDLPAGGQRLLQGATGYRATIVNGEVVVRDDAITEARPGRLIRAGREMRMAAE
ncbi:amidohydrolase [Marinicauda salina]|uniref:Amidohydrolase n=1 Tax=Marinicauda salina TaxID=2135793 RepID=A0A2U2BQT7_9PROT|nr:amidohydrolase family protein [Marinicauda salina]PWE16374.1 amidohydrolase [Marinicauda salina]